MDASLDLDASSAAVQEIEALQDDIEDLKLKVKQLRQESQEVRAEVWPPPLTLSHDRSACHILNPLRAHSAR